MPKLRVSTKYITRNGIPVRMGRRGYKYRVYGELTVSCTVTYLTAYRSNLAMETFDVNAPMAWNWCKSNGETKLGVGPCISLTITEVIDD